jgi:hypothetical protein
MVGDHAEWMVFPFWSMSDVCGVSLWRAFLALSHPPIFGVRRASLAHSCPAWHPERRPLWRGWRASPALSAWARPRLAPSRVSPPGPLSHAPPSHGTPFLPSHTLEGAPRMAPFRPCVLVVNYKNISFFAQIKYIE